MNILLGITGSVAATLAPKIIEPLHKAGYRVVVVATEASLYFWDKDSVNVPVFIEEDEWPGDSYDKELPVKHIELREWADIMLIAPLTANTLAKMTNGLSDNLLTSIVRAWDLEKPIIIAPAMNTKMWEHPITAQHIATLKDWCKLHVIQPITKKLACGDEGIGAMADVDDIMTIVNKKFECALKKSDYLQVNTPKK